MGAAEKEVLPQATLLLVDDEANILSSLRRLFRTQDYRILSATSGAEGIALLEKEMVDLIISDMRMPGMSGTEFLAQVAQRWPNVVRILLTGYADLTSTIDAINKGSIYRYVSKPWEDNDLRLTVHQALEQQHLKRERERLVALVAKQNRELKELNADLEAKVVARTEEIRQTADMLDLAYRDMKRGYFEAIPVFAHLMEMREGESTGHGRRVGHLSQAVAAALGMDADGVQDVHIAGVLHDIGKIALSDELLQKPLVTLSPEERRRMMRHPVAGQAALLALEPLQNAARLIRHHHERFDGGGYPDQLKGDEIPLGARIIAAANDFDALQLGWVLEGQLSAKDAREYLTAASGTRYDPQVLESLFQWLDEHPDYSEITQDRRLASEDLCEGMVLARDLVSSEGILLLARERVLDARLIERIKLFEREEQRGFTLFVKRE